MITEEHIRLFNRFLNLCENDNGSPENDYKSVYRYRDGNGGRRQVTLGKGFTEDGGNLARVLEAYFANGGNSAELKAKRSKVGAGTLASDDAFCKALSAAGAEPAMQRAQDKVFRDAYLGPAIAWAEREGFNQPLSYAVAVDSYLHSGKMSQHLRDRFSEVTPRAGGDEKAWMRAYCRERMAWFQRSTGPLKTCVFRPKFFLEQMDAGNWSFSCPLRIAEKGKIC
jgi:hypothetical protein